MRAVYLPALVGCVAGIGLLVTSAVSTTGLAVLGFTLVAPVVRGVGLIALVFSAVALLAAYGSTLPPRPREARPPAGERQGHSEAVGDPLRQRRDLSRRA